jgi:hypothetical protein
MHVLSLLGVVYVAVHLSLVNQMKITTDNASRHASFVDTEINIRLHKRQEISWLLSSELASQSTSMHFKMVCINRIEEQLSIMTR